MTMNPAWLHLDGYRQRDRVRKPLVNSLLTLSLAVGISVHETTLGTTVANLGFEESIFPAPVFHGDTIRVETEVLKRRASSSRPNQGVVRSSTGCSIRTTSSCVAPCETHSCCVALTAADQSSAREHGACSDRLVDHLTFGRNRRHTLCFASSYLEEPRAVDLLTRREEGRVGDRPAMVNTELSAVTHRTRLEALDGNGHRR